MTTYAIGDLQGCLDPLHRLLEHIRFDPGSDRLWFVGDIVNRGPQSLPALRFVKSLGDSAITVLGNHDLHLLAVVAGVRKASSKDTLNPVINAKDRDELCDWLSRRPMLHVNAQLGYALVHAGIHPEWDLPMAQSLADELHDVLSYELTDFLGYMYGNTPERWSLELSYRKRRRFAINAFTRMRYCTVDGAMNFDFNGPPSQAPSQLIPWYRVRHRLKLPVKVVFGHWSSHPGMAAPDIIPTDRGCVWGGCLTAYALESGQSYTVRCD